MALGWLCRRSDDSLTLNASEEGYDGRTVGGEWNAVNCALQATVT